MRIWNLMIFAMAVMAYPDINCPGWMGTERLASDLGLLADTVSWNGGYERIDGIYATYDLVAEAEGIYDTRMRIYESIAMNEYFISFRPTQQTPAGGDIHNNRRMVPCFFFPECIGRVHDRFQQAFVDLLDHLPEDVIETRLVNQTIHMGSHSLGGALQLFMAVYLSERFNTTAATILGLAGPFIGDEEFTAAYPMRNDRWWQIESINRANPSEFDGTVEFYNVDDGGIYIQKDAICGLTIDKLADSYGMHDIRNYRNGLYHS